MGTRSKSNSQNSKSTQYWHFNSCSRCWTILKRQNLVFGSKLEESVFCCLSYHSWERCFTRKQNRNQKQKLFVFPWYIPWTINLSLEIVWDLTCAGPNRVSFISLSAPSSGTTHCQPSLPLKEFGLFKHPEVCVCFVDIQRAFCAQMKYGTLVKLLTSNLISSVPIFSRCFSVFKLWIKCTFIVSNTQLILAAAYELLDSSKNYAGKYLRGESVFFRNLFANLLPCHNLPFNCCALIGFWQRVAKHASDDCIHSNTFR